ncbi:TPA: NAD-dependent protein deacylase [Candidatus Bipolaricaulota bacterium]|nr:NAD-dependent protein deacylase [Candidatus Bipolaricaulota bacterium]
MAELEGRVARLAELLRGAKYALALTGAGVSTESGIPDFRSPGSGLWAKVDPMEVASWEAFRRNPQKFYQFWRERLPPLLEAQPNVTHIPLAGLEERGLLQGIITQNIDNLHREAGSKQLWEVHGNYRRAVCTRCGRRYRIEELLAKLEEDDLPYCDGCGGLLKPDVVLFGEQLPQSFAEAAAAVARTDLLIALGTSLEVYPVASLVPQAAHGGAKVTIVNRDPTPYDHLADLVIHSQLGPVMELLQRELSFEQDK